jgi:hypothetical protein
MQQSIDVERITQALTYTTMLAKHHHLWCKLEECLLLECTKLEV